MTKLNPQKVHVYLPEREDYFNPSLIPNIPSEIGLSTDEYYNALAISTYDTFQIHFKRTPNYCYVNNYFDDGLMV